MVGTPTKLVMRSRSISSSARSGPHLYMSTSFAPASQQLSMTATQPVTWNSGTIRMNAVGNGCGSDGSVVRPLAAARQAKENKPCSTARWVDTAPLGWPVVPEV